MSNGGACEEIAGGDAAARAQVAAEQASALYRKGLLPYLTNIINGSVVVYVLRDGIDRARGTGWLVTLIALTLARIGLWRFHQRHEALLSPRAWAALFTLGFALSGLVWGSTALFLYAKESVANHSLIAFVVGGMVAGATATTSSYMPAFGLFALTALSPLVIRLLVSGQPVEMAMGGVLALFGIAMTELARRAGCWFKQTTTLRISNDQLVKNLRARNEFLAVASHELRTPLSAMRLTVQSLEHQMSGAAMLDPGSVRPRMERLDRQVARLTRLVDAVLTVSGVDKGGPRLVPHEVDLAVVVRSVVEDMAASMPSAAELVSLQIEGSLVGTWDPERIEQVVTNLVSNALKYGAGSAVTVSLAESAKDVVLTVQDRGPGIAHQDMQRIFEQFYRTGERPSASGMGLGLSVVRELVQAMGGSVALASARGEGARFTVRLPRVPPPTSTGAPQALQLQPS